MPIILTVLCNKMYQACLVLSLSCPRTFEKLPISPCVPLFPTRRRNLKNPGQAGEQHSRTTFSGCGRKSWRGAALRQVIVVRVGGVRGPARPTGWATRLSERPTDGEPGAASPALVEQRQVRKGLVCVCVRGGHVGAVEVKGCGRGTRATSCDT